MNKKDLQKYCYKGRGRDVLKSPWSLFKHTYATNGHIIVRVPRLANVPENELAPPNAVQMFIDFMVRERKPLPIIALPKNSTEPCDNCDGSGHEHSCPSCECVCERCDGSGENIKTISVGIGEKSFALEYYIMLTEMPNVTIGNNDRIDTPSYFQFTGGEGLLMPVRGERETHIKAQ